MSRRIFLSTRLRSTETPQVQSEGTTGDTLSTRLRSTETIWYLYFKKMMKKLSTRLRSTETVHVRRGTPHEVCLSTRLRSTETKKTGIGMCGYKKTFHTTTFYGNVPSGSETLQISPSFHTTTFYGNPAFSLRIQPMKYCPNSYLTFSPGARSTALYL